jgi:hypothetical protein
MLRRPETLRFSWRRRRAHADAGVAAAGGCIGWSGMGCRRMIAECRSAIPARRSAISTFHFSDTDVSPPEPDISTRDLGASPCEPGRSLRDLDPRARDPGVPPRDHESPSSEPGLPSFELDLPSSGPGLPSFELDVPSSEPGVPGFDPDSPSSDPGVTLRVPGARGCVAGTPSPGPRCSVSQPAGEDAGGGSGEACDDRLVNVQVGGRGTLPLTRACSASSPASGRGDRCVADGNASRRFPSPAALARVGLSRKRERRQLLETTLSVERPVRAPARAAASRRRGPGTGTRRL